MKRTALYNGKVRTPSGYAEAVLVEGQTISCVGRNEEVLGYPVDEKVNLGGRLTLPGFIDGHLHLLAYGLSLANLDLTGARSVEEVRSRIRIFQEKRRLSPEEWLVAIGWNDEQFSEGRIPTREDLDDLVPENPAILVRICGHVATVNTVGLRLLGITGATRLPQGVADLDDSGEPTGVLREGAVSYAHSKRPAAGRDALRTALLRGGTEMARWGLTSVHSDDLASAGGDVELLLDLYGSMDGEGVMPLRVTEQLLLRDRKALDKFLAMGWRTGDGAPCFHIGPLKLLTDGSMGGRTALLRSGYSDMPQVRGMPIYGQEELDDLVGTAHRAGMQVATHAIGDGALDMCLHAFEAALARHPREARHYIVHCQMGDMEQYRRMARLGIGAAIQPPFVPSDRLMALRRIGKKRALAGYAWKTLLELGIFLSGGSDAPVESFSPLWGIASAVTRQDEAGEPAGGWNPSQKLTVEKAVDLYTKGGAYASFEEHRKGTIEVGKLADVVVLDRDIFTVPPKELKNVQVDLTMVGGRCTHRAI